MANQFWDLRDYGVAERDSCVHFAGNPMNQLSQIGLTVPRLPERIPMTTPATRGSENCVAEVVFENPRWKSEALGVGHKPESVSLVGRTNGASRYAVPLRIVPERGQVSEYTAHSSIKQRCNVFHDDELRSYFANKSGVLGPETTTTAFNPLPTTGIRNVLAGEPATDGVNTNAIGSKSLAGKVSNVMVARNLRPMLGEDAARKLFDLAERDGLETARAFKTKGEAADAAEKVEDAKFAHPRTRSRRGVAAGSYPSRETRRAARIAVGVSYKTAFAI